MREPLRYNAAHKGETSLQRENRRLAAIVAADIAGYSRLIGRDEEGTLRALRAHRAELIDPAIGEHGGRIANTAGDSLLLEFPSAVDAVRSAIAVQEGLIERNAGIDEAAQIRFRVGINVGDVVAEGADLLGDGVNIAARLENLCEPGGLTLSDDAHRQVRDRLEVDWHDAGEHEVKNIARPVHVWHWTPAAAPAATAPAGEALPLPDKPSIAVLPFDNMSGDPEQEYFSDGMTEDIITALSRLRWLFVIARNSTFAYKGKAIDIKQVGRELGVRYVLEGSVRKAGSRIRVTAQLIEAETGNHIWAERYDRELADIFDLQDELTEAISAQVDAELAGSERALANKKPTTDLDAWELYQRGLWHFYKYTKDDFAEARRLLRLATERAPDFANAYAALAVIGPTEISYGDGQDRQRTLEQGLRDAEMAVALDDRDGTNQFALGIICTMLGDGERAIPTLEKSVDLNPSSAASHYGLGLALYWFGRAEEALPRLSLAIRLSPHDPRLWIFHIFRSYAHVALDEFDLAIADAKAAIQSKSNNSLPFLALAAAYRMSGRNEQARTAHDRARGLNPELSAAEVMSTMHPPYLEKLMDALRQAGLPEE